MSDSSILGALNQSQQAQNLNLEPIKQMMFFVRTAQDPNAALQQVIQNNPKVAQIYNLMQQSGKSPEELFYYLAKQRGVDPEAILSALR